MPIPIACGHLVSFDRPQVLSVYSREENIGEELLSRVHMGRYRSDGYVWHASIKVGAAVEMETQIRRGEAGRAGEKRKV